MYCDFYANWAANRFFGETLLLLSIFSNVNAPTGWLDNNDLTERQMFINGLAIVSLVFLNKFHQDCRSVSAIHSTAIKGKDTNVAGTFHNFLYHFHCVHALWMASLILAPVFQNHSIGFSTQYSAVWNVSVNAFRHVQSVQRGAESAVLPKLFHNFFRKPTIFLAYEI